MYLDAQGQPAGFSYGGAVISNASVNGHLAVGVPGLVKGLLAVHAAKGHLPLARVMAPAIDVAENGFPVYPSLAAELADRVEVLRHFPAAAKIFLKADGTPYRLGERLVQKDLAQTLRQVRDGGAKAFYEGRIARLIVAEMERGKGLVSAADLKAYAVIPRVAVTGTYRGYKIAAMPPPSSGGAHIIEIMNILAGDDVGALGFGTAKSIHLLAEAMKRAFADRAEFLGDPAFFKVPLKGLVAPAYGAAWRKTINLEKATPSAELRPGDPLAYESPSTTHLSVIDAAGNAVSTTQTVNLGFGSGVVAAGTGIVLNDEMDDFSKKPGTPNDFGLVGKEANAVAPGKTPLSSMSPTLVFAPDGRLALVVGSPGGPRIISATLQTILNVIDFKMSLPDAVHAARIHHQWLPDALVTEEGGLTPEVAAELTRLGHKLVVKGHIGDVQAVGVAAGVLTGVSDTRAEGRPFGF
jgi:gamma-glutamyltranspeptidase/glutathione hydrolase